MITFVDGEAADSDDDYNADDDNNGKCFKIILCLIFNHWQKKLTFAQPLARELNEWQSPAINQE